MKRLTAVGAALALTIGIASCGGYEQLDVSALDGLPTGSVSFASTEAAGYYLKMTGTAYAGIYGGGCDDETVFTGFTCELLDTSGEASATNLCLGDWDFTGMTIYDTTDTSCTGTAIATCDDVAAFTVAVGANIVFVDCNVAGADVTFDVSLL